MTRAGVEARARSLPEGDYSGAVARTLDSPGLQKALGDILETLDVKATELQNADLASPEGLARARLLQGERKGLTIALDLIFGRAEL